MQLEFSRKYHTLFLISTKFQNSEILGGSWLVGHPRHLLLWASLKWNSKFKKHADSHMWYNTKSLSVKLLKTLF